VTTHGASSSLTTPARVPILRDRLAIALLYAAAWAPLVVNRGLYWDDWTLVGRSPGDLVQGFTELGLPLGGVAYAALLALPLPGLIGHVLVFATYLASTLILHAILRRLPGLSRMDALIAALTFALLPVNYARIALIDAMYGLSLLAFLAATWLLIRYLEDGGLRRRVGALLLYLFSFYTASLLVLYVVPVALAAWLLRRSRTGPIVPLALRHADFLALPVAYWLVKGAILTPTGVYEGYNALSARGLLQVPRALLSVPGQVLVEPLSRAVEVAGVVGVVAGIVVAIWLVGRDRVIDDGRPVSALILAIVGAAMVVLGVFAYLAVGLTPTIWDWSSRHQLLVPLGAGLLAAAAARPVGRLGPAGHAGVVVVGLLIGISAIANFRTLVAYQVDWFKQQALIGAVRATPELQAARHIRVTDSATAFNALHRTYRFYELNALFEQATGNTRRLVALAGKEPPTDELGQFIERPAYHMGEYVPSPVDVEVSVSAGDSPHALDVLRLVILEVVDPTSFETEVARLIEVRAIPVAGSP
jgi:hypothetical protein